MRSVVVVNVLHGLARRTRLLRMLIRNKCSPICLQESRKERTQLMDKSRLVCV